MGLVRGGSTSQHRGNGSVADLFMAALVVAAVVAFN